MSIGCQNCPKPHLKSGKAERTMWCRRGTAELQLFGCRRLRKFTRENISVTLSGTSAAPCHAAAVAAWRRQRRRYGCALALHCWLCDSLVRRRRRRRISRLGEDRARGKERSLRRPPRDFSSTKFLVRVRASFEKQISAGYLSKDNNNKKIQNRD